MKMYSSLNQIYLFINSFNIKIMPFYHKLGKFHPKDTRNFVKKTEVYITNNFLVPLVLTECLPTLIMSTDQQWLKKLENNIL